MENLLQFAKNSNPKPKGMMNEFLERNEKDFRKSQSLIDEEERNEEEEERNEEVKIKSTQMSLTNETIKPLSGDCLGNDNIQIETGTNNYMRDKYIPTKYLISKQLIYDLHKFVIREDTQFSYSFFYSSKKGDAGGNCFISKGCYENLKAIGVKVSTTQETDEELQKTIEQNKYLEENYESGSCNLWKEDGDFYFTGDISHCGAEHIFKNINSMIKIWKCGVLHRDCNGMPYQHGTIESVKKEANEYKHDVFLYTPEEMVVIEDRNELTTYNKRAKNTVVCKCGGTMKVKPRERGDIVSSIWWLTCDKCDEQIKNVVDGEW